MGVRHHRRYKVQQEVLAVVRTDTAVVATIRDISESGVGLEYLHFRRARDHRPSTGHSRLELVGAQSGATTAFPCEIVYDVPVSDTFPGELHVENRRCGMRFCSLNGEKRATLNQFLRQHDPEQNSAS